MDRNEKRTHLLTKETDPDTELLVYGLFAVSQEGLTCALLPNPKKLSSSLPRPDPKQKNDALCIPGG